MKKVVWSPIVLLGPLLVGTDPTGTVGFNLSGFNVVAHQCILFTFSFNFFNLKTAQRGISIFNKPPLSKWMKL